MAILCTSYVVRSIVVSLVYQWGAIIMSPGLAILCCAIVELDMESGPEGLIGTVVRFMDDVFGIYAVGSSAEEQLVMGHYGRIAVG